jgi:hypothetical protein
MQSGIYGAFGEVEGVPAVALDGLDDGVPVGFPCLQRSEYQEIQMVLEGVVRHT